jgi:serine protease DegQ
MLKKVWLGVAQLVTVGVLLVFMIMTLKPQWLPVNFEKMQSRGSVNANIDPNTNLTIRQAPANLSGLSYSSAVKAAMPSVVRVYATRKSTEELSSDDKDSGSGVIIDAQGFIVTNQHVIDGATRILVVLNDDHFEN